jgi:alkylhydroperoxidase family enzyme
VSTAATPRLKPLPVEQWDDSARAALRANMKQAADRYLSGAPDAPRMPNVLAVLMHHPRLAGPWLAYNSVLLGEGTLSPRYRELLILRVAWRTRSDYEWLQHVQLALRLGLSAGEIEAVSRGAGADAWTPLESDLLAAADQLLDRYLIDDATWTRLAAHFDARQLMEIAFAVGSYTCLAMAFNSWGLQLDPDLDPGLAPVMPESQG